MERTVGTLRRIEVDGHAVWLSWELDDAWGADTWRAVAAEPSAGFLLRALPGGGEAVVKIYRRRDAHGLLRRLRAGRALREGRGYLAFNRASVPTARLLLFGEARRRLLHEWGVVATRREPVPTVADAFAADARTGRLHSTAELLASIHNAGLVHGDPLLRNFLDTAPRPIAFDLPSWGWRRRRTRTEDMVRFLGSIVAATHDDGATARAVLARYRTRAPDLPDDDEALLAAARRYANDKRAVPASTR